MRRATVPFLAIAFLLCAMVCTPRVCIAGALTAEATLTVGNQDFFLPIGFDPNTGNWGIGTYDNNTGEFAGVEITEAEFEATINGVFDPDPQISYGIAIVDLGAPSTFGFFFSTPIVLPGTSNTVNSLIGGSLVDVNGNGVSMTPFPNATVQISDVGAPTTNMGVDVGPAFPLGPSGTYGIFTVGPQPGPSGTWTTLSATVGFTLSGGGDIAVLTGLAQIVPEPSSVVLFALGGAGAMVIGIRRRRSR